MNKMPGFTAEVSLYKVSMEYEQVMSGLLAMPDPSQTVSPQVSCSFKFCRRCEEAGGECIHTRHGCFCL